MMKKISLIFLLLIFFTGCASPPNESQFAVLLEDPESYALIAAAQRTHLAQARGDFLDLTVEAGYSDGYAAQLFIRLTRTDGGSLEGLIGDLRLEAAFDFYPFDVSATVAKPLSFSTTVVPALSGGAQACYVATVQSRTPFSELTVFLDGLYSADGNTMPVQADLSCRFELAACPTRRYDYMPGLVKRIVLSPMGLSIDIFEPEGGVTGMGAPLHDIHLMHEDGTRLGVSAAQFAQKQEREIGWSASQQSNGTMNFIRVDFYPYLDPETVRAVEIDGVQYRLGH